MNATNGDGEESFPHACSNVLHGHDNDHGLSNTAFYDHCLPTWPWPERPPFAMLAASYWLHWPPAEQSISICCQSIQLQWPGNDLQWRNQGKERTNVNIEHCPFVACLTSHCIFKERPKSQSTSDQTIFAALERFHRATETVRMAELDSDWQRAIHRLELLLLLAHSLALWIVTVLLFATKGRI